MAKNLFKKRSMTDTLVNVGVGGAANVAADYLLNMVQPEDDPWEPDTVNIVKLAVGVLGGTMVSNRILRAACDGIATVGVSNLVSGLMNDTAGTSDPLPDNTGGGTDTVSGMKGMLGARPVPGHRNYVSLEKKKVRVSGVNGAENILS